MPSTPKTTTTTTEPPAYAKPFIVDNLNKAKDLYDNGAPLQYQGDTVAGQSDATKAAIAQQIALGTGGQGNLNAAAGITAGIANGTGISNAGVGGLQAGSNYTNPGLGTLDSTVKGLGSNGAIDYLTSTANGSQIGNNPYLNANIAAQQGNIAEQLKNVTNPTIDGGAIAGGRFGSGAYANLRNNADSTAAKAMSDVAVNALTGQYNTDKTNQLSAANTIGGLNQSDTANALSGATALASANQNQQDSRTQASNLLAQYGITKANTQLGAAGQAGTAFQNQALASQLLGSAGAQQDQYSQDYLNSIISKWDTAQQQPLTNISNMISLANSGNYSSQSSQTYTNPYAQILGGAGSIASILALCDIRTKNIIREVGIFPGGIPMYEFTYKDDPNSIVYVGPVAHEVEAILSSAVVEVGGMKMILTDAFMREAA